VTSVRPSELGSAPYTTSPFPRPGTYYSHHPRPTVLVWYETQCHCIHVRPCDRRFSPAAQEGHAEGQPPARRPRALPHSPSPAPSPPLPLPLPLPLASPLPPHGRVRPLPLQDSLAWQWRSPASLLALIAIALAALVLFKLWCRRGTPPSDPKPKPVAAGALGGRRRRGAGGGDGTPGHTPAALVAPGHWAPLPAPRGKGSEILVHGAKQFSLGELAEATNGFSAQRVLGQGSFGEVFYGELPGPTPARRPCE